MSEGDPPRPRRALRLALQFGRRKEASALVSSRPSVNARPWGRVLTGTALPVAGQGRGREGPECPGQGTRPVRVLLPRR